MIENNDFVSEQTFHAINKLNENDFFLLHGHKRSLGQNHVFAETGKLYRRW